MNAEIFILKPLDKNANQPIYIILADDEDTARDMTHIHSKKAKQVPGGQSMEFEQDIYKNPEKTSCEVFSEPHWKRELKGNVATLTFNDPNSKEIEKKRKKTIDLRKNIPEIFNA